LITSDSDFEQAEIAAGYNPEDEHPSNKKKSMKLKKDVSKTFKKMLTSNHQRLSTPDSGLKHQLNRNESAGADSTKYNGSAFDKT
jgi:hypothetical protein